MSQYSFQIKGMHCAACSTRVEKAVSALGGVQSCAVSLLTNSMSVEGDVAAQAVIEAIEGCGFEAMLQADHAPQEANESEREQKKLSPGMRLLISGLLLLPLMWVSMAHTMWGMPLPASLAHHPTGVALIQMALALVIIGLNWKFFENGLDGLCRKAPNMDTLVCLGSGAAFGYSLIQFFQIRYLASLGELSAADLLLHDLYFDSSAMILVLISIGKWLETRAKGKTTDALTGLLALRPQKAVILCNGEEKEVPADQVCKDDIFIVRPGDAIPVDGVVIEGTSALDTSMMTGESVPVNIQNGDEVCGATINLTGYLKCRATRVGKDTTHAQIVELMRGVSASKAPIARVADRVASIFVPVVMGIAVMTGCVWGLVGESVAFALSRAISVLVISCPCALGLATPVAIMVANGVGAKRGILFKSAASIEQMGKLDIMAFDKTGTLTNGSPEVTDILPASSVEISELLQCAYALEAKSEHPLGRAIMNHGAANKDDIPEVESFEAVPGCGVKGVWAGAQAYGGHLDFVSSYTEIPNEIKATAEALASEGKTPVYFVHNGKYLGCLAMSDTLRPDVVSSLQALKALGIEPVMISGDNAISAHAMAQKAGISEVIAGVLPHQKAQTIQKWQQKGRVGMVGDGINDAPALASADIGIAIGSGTQIAMDAAQVVLVKNQISDVVCAVRLSRETLKIIRQNLFWAFSYNLAGIPLAAGAFIPILGWQLSPMFAAAAMSISSFCVVTNALRLNRFK